MDDFIPVLGQHPAVGFTGTREQMTGSQIVALGRVLVVLQRELVKVGTPRQWWEWHYGMCVGADSQAAYLARASGFTLIGHPPTNKKLICYLPAPDRTELPMPYNVRNAAIVRQSVLLIAAPKTNDEILRSGTWMTIRMARKNNSSLILVLPDGTVVQERVEPPINLIEEVK